MTQNTDSTHITSEIVLMPMMRVKDLEQLQATLNQAGYDYQLELEEGKILVVGPSDIDSSEIGVL
ncbi:MAG TPA: hypothetical protein VIQ31_19055, partial [Phormidium sp.]